MLSEEELEAIDTWRFNNRIATRSDAIRRLCQMGLTLDSKLTPIFEAFKGYVQKNADFMMKMGKSQQHQRVMTVNETELANAEIHAMMLNSLSALGTLKITIRDLTAKAYALKAESSFDTAMSDVKSIDTDFAEIIDRYKKMSLDISSEIEEITSLRNDSEEKNK